MKRIFSLIVVSGLAAFSAFGQGDPNIQVGPINVDCKTFNCSGDPTLIGTTGFTLMSNGDPTADNPWYILLAIPGSGKTDAQGGTDPTAPTITKSGFTISAGVDAGDFLSSTSGDIYAFASAKDGGLKGDNSMNATNLFGTAEQTAFGKTPDFFDIFVYTVSAGSLTGNSSFSFTSSLTEGTFVAGLGCEAKKDSTCPTDKAEQQFSTPFTTAGLVSSTSSSSSTSTSSTTTTTTSSTTQSGPFATGGAVPEPSSIVLLGSVLAGLSAALRKKFVRS